MSVQGNDDRPSTTPSSVEPFDLEPRPDLNGLLVRQPGEQAIYMVDWGYKCLLSYNNLIELFIPNPQVIDWDVSTIPTGTPVYQFAVLIRADGSPGVYLLDYAPQPGSGTIFKRPIKSMEILKRYQFDMNKVRQLPVGVVNGIPTGPDMAAPTPL